MSEFDSNDRSKPIYYSDKKRWREVVPMAHAVEGLLARRGMLGQLDAARLDRAWHSLMGVAIARQTESLALHQGKMYLKLHSSALRQQLFLNRDRLVEILNRELGRAVITEIVFV